jgi:PLD-like domain
MSDFDKSERHGALLVRAYRGEGVCLLAMDLDEGAATPDFAGFSIEVKYPNSTKFFPLSNRLHFDYLGPRAGKKRFASTEAPFQKFRWIHVPGEILPGNYTYRVSAQYWQQGDVMRQGDHLTIAISLAPETHAGLLNVGFTRGFVSSQAYVDRFDNNRNIIPAESGHGAELEFDASGVQREHEWLGFEARKILFELLETCVDDPEVTVDALVYEMREPMVLAHLERLGSRLRVIIDDHDDYGEPDSNESIAATRLRQSAGASKVKRMHFGRQQHNKVFIVKRNGVPEQVIAGSMNFSLRGIYIQANNVFKFSHPGVAQLFEDLFQSYWLNASGFRDSELQASWHMPVQTADASYSFCFAPHRSNATSLKPVADSIRNAQSSVLWAAAFIYQSAGPVRDALDDLITRPLFSYGTSERAGNLDLFKPSGARAVVPFAFLAKSVPEPFSQEWSGDSVSSEQQFGVHMHHKFIVCDFNGARPVLYAGSSNLAGGGEEANGDNLMRVTDRKVVVAYAIEALRLFDHYSFRATIKAGDDAGEIIKLKRPPQDGGKPWFAEYFRSGSQREADRLLFARGVE